MKSKLAIVHFNSIELYPPVMNWLKFLSEKSQNGFFVRIFTFSPEKEIQLFSLADQNIKIYRSKRMAGSALTRFLSYCIFYLKTIIQLVWWRPEHVMYYETLSSFPVYFYKRYINREARIFIHYHEYVSPAEIKSGMRLVRLVNHFERKLLSSCEWISHTNEDRLKLFCEDNIGLKLPIQYIAPNFPPGEWFRISAPKVEIFAPIKIVYVGALSLDTMYIKEMAQWVMSLRGKALWDIYSSNYDSSVIDYLEGLACQYIKFKGSVGYYELPDKLKKYDVGVVLYKGHIPNYVYNAPNKLFEYYACGLDVWFPMQMKGCIPYATTGIYPKIVGIDFQNLENIELYTDHKGFSYQMSEYSCEKIFDDMYAKIGVNIQKEN